MALKFLLGISSLLNKGFLFICYLSSIATKSYTNTLNEIRKFYTKKHSLKTVLFLFIRFLPMKEGVIFLYLNPKLLNNLLPLLQIVLQELHLQHDGRKNAT